MKLGRRDKTLSIAANSFMNQYNIYKNNFIRCAAAAKRLKLREYRFIRKTSQGQTVTWRKFYKDESDTE